MVQFTLRFLGQFQISVDETPVTNFHSDKARALLAYLALEPQEHGRAELAALLWPEIDDKYARANLRNTLYRLRQTLDAAATDADDPLLTASRQTVRFNPAAADVDVLRFQALVENRRVETAPDLAQLEEATALYQGELLADFGAADAPPFEEWLLLRRELLHQRALMAFRTHALHYESVGGYAQAYKIARRLLALDPYHEESYRQVMRLLAQMEQPNQALQLLEEMRTVLHTELGVKPSEETLALAHKIAEGNYAQQEESLLRVESSVAKSEDTTPDSTTQPVHASPIPSTTLDLRDVPDPGPFFGRTQERRQIAQWLLHDRCRIVAILGIGGMGKTSLAAQSVRELVGAQESPFDMIFWRSLVNAPLLAELLPPLLQTLSNQKLTEIPKSLDEQLRLLLDYLRQQRVLLVLDNMESILEPERAGAFRVGYEVYGQLIQQMATLAHQSCLLLTSRERPRDYNRLERDSPLIQSLQLVGLDDEAGHELLAQRGLAGESKDETMLITRYSGNPLALKLVADTVDELFGGDLAEFLEDDSLIFDDIRTVLDQHFDRLTDLEQQILFWLAVEREPIPLQALRENLWRPPKQRDFLEALRSLQRRSLVEKSGADLALQNVVTEYLTECLVELVVAEIETGSLHCLQQQALLKAQAKEYVRDSQIRLILKPIGKQLIARLGLVGLQAKCQQILAALRADIPRTHHYAGGNLLNLLLSLEIDITGWNFSQLSIRQVNLQDAKLTDVDFSAADFNDTLFVDVFGGVRALAMHPDDELLAAAAEGKPQIRLWQVSDGQLLKTLSGHRLKGTCLAFHPAGHLLASGSEDHTIRLWDVATGHSVKTLTSHQRTVACVAFSPDGRLLASSDIDRVVHIWDVESWEILLSLPRHAGWVSVLTFHPLLQGPHYRLATINGPAISLWDIQGSMPTNSASVRLIKNLQENESSKRAMAFNGDGTLLSMGDLNGNIVVWHVQNQTVVHMLKGHTDIINRVAFSADGKMLVSSSQDGTLRLWDLATGRPMDVLRGHSGSVPAIAISNDGETLASGGVDGVVRLWELKVAGERRVVRAFRGSLGELRSLSVSSGDGSSRCFLAAGGAKGWCHVWHIQSSTENVLAQGNQERVSARGTTFDTTYHHLLKGHKGGINVVRFCPHTSIFATASDDQTVRIWNAESGKCLAVLNGHTARVTALAYNLQGTALASGSSNGDVYLWKIDEVGRYERRFELSHDQGIVRTLAFTPDGKTLISKTSVRMIRLWDTESGSILQAIPQLEDFNTQDVDASGKRLVAGSLDGYIHIWEVLEQFIITPAQRTFRHAASPLDVVAFSPLDNWLVSGSAYDPILRIWDPITGDKLHAVEGFGQGVNDLSFFPHSNVLAATGNDGLIRLCDAESGSLLQTFAAPGPYAGMNIIGVTGISEAQRAALKALGAVVG